MYTLYHSPGTCSLATLCMLNQLQQPVLLINKNKVGDFTILNAVNAVPVLIDGQQILREGAAIMIYLLHKHNGIDYPVDQPAIQAIAFANATMHPAYGKLFFVSKCGLTEDAEAIAMQYAAKAINHLWEVVEKELAEQRFYGGDAPGPADFMLTVYSRWGQYFPVNIHIGANAQRMINAVAKSPAFIRALEMEAEVI